MSIKQVHSKRLGKKVWKYDIWIEGQRRRDSGFSTRADCERAVAKLRLDAHQRKYGLLPEAKKPARSFTELLARRLAELGTADQRNRRRGVILRAFSATLPDGIAITEIKTLHLAHYDSERLKKNPKLSMRSRYYDLAVISGCLRAASTYFPEMEDYLPPKKPKGIKLSHTLRGRVLSEEEIKRLFAVLEADHQPDDNFHSYRARLDAADALRLALLTGIRTGELFKMRWTQVNFSFKSVTVYATKTDDQRAISIGAQGLAILKRRRQQIKDSEFVFPGGRNGHRASIYRPIRRACKKAGIPYGRDIAGGIVPYTARHTAATIMLESGVDPATVSDRLGHRSFSTTLRYTHPTQRSRQRAAETLEEFMTRSDQLEESGSETLTRLQEKAASGKH